MGDGHEDEIILDFSLIGAEARAKILKEIDVFIDTKVREILLNDPIYCLARGWTDEPQTV